MIILPPCFIIIGAVLAKITGNIQWTMIGAVCFTLTLVSVYFGWLWTAGNLKYENIQDSNNNQITFRTFFLSSIFYSFIIAPLLKTFLAENYSTALTSASFLSFICFLYSIHLVAKNIRLKEQEIFKSNNSAILDFFLVWILPIGVWFLNPRMKKILNQGLSNINQPLTTG